MKKYILLLLVLPTIFLSCHNSEAELKPLSKIVKNDVSLYLFKDNGLYGYKNKKGDIVIPAKYRYLSAFHENLAIFSKTKNRYGYLNRLGQVYCKDIFLKANPFSEGLAIVKFINKDTYVISNSLEGNIIENIKDYLKENRYFDKTFDYAPRFGSFQNGMCSFTVWLNAKFSVTGFINRNGKVVVPPGSRNEQYSEGFSILLGTSMYFVDKKGNKALGPYIDCELFSDGLAPVCLSAKQQESADSGLGLFFSDPKTSWGMKHLTYYNHKWGFINKKGTVVIEKKYDKAKSFHEGLAAVLVGVKWVRGKFNYFIPFGGKWGFINKNGQMVIPPKFDKVSNFNNGIAKVRIGARTKISYMMFEAGHELVIEKVGGQVKYINKKGTYVSSPSSRSKLKI